MWVEAIGKGVAVGMGLALVVGPVFFSLINAAITKGFKEGAKLAIGIFASDLLYATLFWLGVGGYLAQLGQSMTLAICGGVVLLIMGFTTFSRRPQEIKAATEPDKRNVAKRYGAVGKGFVLNTFNPGTSVVWLGAGAGGADMAARGGLPLQGAYMASILLTVLLTDLAKAYLAKSLKSYLTPKTMHLINRGAGVVMFGAGLLLILSVALRWS